MHASLEPLAAVVRVFAEGNDYGDPYTWAATCRWLDHETVELMGALRGPTKDEWQAVLATMAEWGVTTVRYRRCRGGAEVNKRWKKTGSSWRCERNA